MEMSNHDSPCFVLFRASPKGRRGRQRSALIIARLRRDSTCADPPIASMCNDWPPPRASDCQPIWVKICCHTLMTNDKDNLSGSKSVTTNYKDISYHSLIQSYSQLAWAVRISIEYHAYMDNMLIIWTMDISIKSTLSIYYPNTRKTRTTRA